ncbi:FtsH protease activity modulator HflK [Chitinimonas taiwanensis]|uniref:Protein HflK n=1 Tax=Chitinimonas taiwanensis DSM 18899 TaxID=1121279 RepID=A0A1K2H7F9_9NEIS|nr:FtsH protease activity modulator HflK [Chitinimonas taiwanensis]SFZ72585.1 protease FtsH subunit HflK [Chitinimonas taiwanensis DSM 18899]
MSQDPQWGRRGKDGPPDLDEIVRQFSNKLKQFLGGKPSGPSNSPSGSPGNAPDARTMIGGMSIVLGVIAVLWVASGFYVVDAREESVVLRFGRYVETTGSGLHWRMPWPIEQNEIVKLSEVRSVEVGFRGDAKSRVEDESLMLTQDQNIIEMQLEVQYDVKSAYDFVFNNATTDSDARDLVKQAAETAIREVVGRNKVDFVLNEGRGQIAADTTRLIQTLLDDYGTGIRVSRININDVQPPEAVQAAFADAVKAGQDKVKQTNEGIAYANDVIPKAKGYAARLLQEAEGYKQSVISRAEGDAARFKQVASEYAKAPQVTRDRLYIDAMQQVMSNSTKVLVDQKSNGNLLYLPLDKLMQMSSQQAPAVESVPAAAADAPVTIVPRTSPLRGEREGR